MNENNNRDKKVESIPIPIDVLNNTSMQVPISNREPINTNKIVENYELQKNNNALKENKSKELSKSEKRKLEKENAKRLKEQQRLLRQQEKENKKKQELLKKEQQKNKKAKNTSTSNFNSQSANTNTVINNNVQSIVNNDINNNQMINNINNQSNTQIVNNSNIQNNNLMNDNIDVNNSTLVIKENEKVKENLKNENKVIQEVVNAEKENIDIKPLVVPDGYNMSAPQEINMDNVTSNNNLAVDAETAKMVQEYKNEQTSNQVKNKKYKYKVKDQKGKIIVDTYDAFNEVQVRTFLQSQGYEIVSIEEVQLKGKMSKSLFSSVKTMKNKDLVFFLTQLSTYIKSGIPLLESMNILERQTKNKNHRLVFQKIIYELNSGINFSDSLENQGTVFPRILINMVKTSELTGNLTEVLDDMSSYFSRKEKNRKEIIGALTYPTILLLFALAVLTFIILYVVPQFTSMYAQLGSELPWITKALIAFSDFLGKNIIYIILAIASVVIIFYVMYKNVRKFKYAIQWILLKIPVVSKVIMYNEVVTFTSTFSSLIKHDVFITDSMEILGKVSDNELYKEMIKNAVVNLSAGNGVSVAFENKWAFPSIAYEMLLTGEKTGKLGPMMESVADYFESEQSVLINQLKSLVEPVMIVALAGMVGVIILSVVLPMFDMYSSVL